jgi:hypothetical protein
MVVSSPSAAREGTGASLPQPTEIVAAAPVASVVDVVEGVVRGAEPLSPRPVAAAVEAVLVPSQSAAASQEHDAPEGTIRAASSEIQEAEEGTGAALSQGVASGEAQSLELAHAPWAAAFEAGDNAEDDEEAARATPLSAGWRGRATRSMS